MMCNLFQMNILGKDKCKVDNFLQDYLNNTQKDKQLYINLHYYLKYKYKNYFDKADKMLMNYISDNFKNMLYMKLLLNQKNSLLYNSYHNFLPLNYSHLYIISNMFHLDICYKVIHIDHIYLHYLKLLKILKQKNID